MQLTVGLAAYSDMNEGTLDNLNFLFKNFSEKEYKDDRSNIIKWLSKYTDINYSTKKKKNLKRRLRKIHGEEIASIQPPSPSKTPNTSIATSRTERLHSLFSKTNQGQYDNQDNLVRLTKNAEAKGEQTILKAVQQRLRKVFPKLYRQYVGPLGSKNCYCDKPTLLHNIAHDILNMTISTEALQQHGGIWAFWSKSD
ncbi:hypothetical protein [Aliivibrio fischeri]|uniref:hypothetical protein n=1 Tax=Aliivibrio fischeri TaxID=668 RepID=UPI0012DA46AE|nr:hypothetical protein [Aliivibrio fischeri]MUL16872.1 hypothetical protein [Aliivibrio fischeri]